MAASPNSNERISWPKRAVVTAGMPYGNKPLHFGHIAGVFVPADAFARFLRDRIGAANVRFISGTDCFGSPINEGYRKLVEAARMYRLGAVAMVRRVLLPAALPAVLTGLRNGLSLAWMFMVAAELIAATRGLGYLLTDGREMGRADIVLAAIVLLALLGKVTDTGMAWLERRLLAWRDTYDTAARG